MHEAASHLAATAADDHLAEVIRHPSSEHLSYYQRNTGALPKIGVRSSDLHRRSSLPSPVNTDGDGFFGRIKQRLTNR